jgi:fermentation-respiration switch protein FrsA (DUF1100 family)
MNLLDNLYSSLIFFPSNILVSSPANEGIPHEEVFIKTPDGEKLHGYFFPASEKTSKVMLYLHGNGDNVGGWYPAPVGIQKYIPVNALLVDYRGYGRSTGKPTIEGVITDAFAMYEYLIQKGYKAENISIYGRSLGGAIALEVASKQKVHSIVLQSTFSSLRDIAKDLYPQIPQIIIQNKFFNSVELIKKINVPVFISHGSEDEIIPVKHSYRLFEAANEPKKLLILKGATHNDVSGYFNEEYFQVLFSMFV